MSRGGVHFRSHKFCICSTTTTKFPISIARRLRFQLSAILNFDVSSIYRFPVVRIPAGVLMGGVADGHLQRTNICVFAGTLVLFHYFVRIRRHHQTTIAVKWVRRIVGQIRGDSDGTGIVNKHCRCQMHGQKQVLSIRVRDQSIVDLTCVWRIQFLFIGVVSVAGDHKCYTHNTRLDSNVSKTRNVCTNMWFSMFNRLFRHLFYRHVPPTRFCVFIIVAFVQPPRPHVRFKSRAVL